MCRCTAKAGLRHSPRALYTRTRLSSLPRLNLDSSLKTTWFHFAAAQFPRARHHSKRRRRWVGIKDSTRYGCRDTNCSSAGCLRMVREDTGAPSEDPLLMEFPLLKKPLHFHGPNEKPPEWLVQYNGAIERADGYVVVSGEYNRCIPPALTNMMDHFPPKSYRCKPCSIVCYSADIQGESELVGKTLGSNRRQLYELYSI
ncbi:hypothetical protein X975_05332, partial [Stegodyphus mimosarum]